MRTFRLFSSSTLPHSGTYALDADASHYLLKVLRASIGLEFVLFDGTGNEFDVVLVDATKKSAFVSILNVSPGLPESPLYSHLAIGISKGDRMDIVMQKATELGVSRITPLFTEHGDVKLKAERLDKKHLHWFGVIKSACEQCGRSLLPQLDEPQRLSDFLANSASEQKFVLYPTSTQKLVEISAPKSVALLIGPEGGLSESEINLALESGFDALQLGPRVLRTETAPLAALTLVQHLWGDL